MPTASPPRAVFLIGYRSSGKSSVAQALAARWGVPWVDTDRMVEEMIGATIAEYFRSRGEGAFRDRETEALRRAIAAIDLREGAPPGGGDRVERRGAPPGSGIERVIATGGGIILRPENVKAIRAAGRVVWLKASPEAIRSRLAGDPATAASRPPLSGGSALEEVSRILAEREPLYRAAAHDSVETDGLAPEEVADRVCAAPGLEAPSA